MHAVFDPKVAQIPIKAQCFKHGPFHEVLINLKLLGYCSLRNYLLRNAHYLIFRRVNFRLCKKFFLISIVCFFRALGVRLKYLLLHIRKLIFLLFRASIK